jgi:nucleotide-binding universal stress UspA family protein
MAVDGCDTAQSLLTVATDAELVVMASQVQGILACTVGSTVAHQLVRQLPCPLLLVPSNYAHVNLAAPSIVRNVLIPLDGSRYAERAVGALAATGVARDARCTLTHVQDMDQLIDRSLDDPRGYLNAIASRAKQKLPQVDTEFVIGFQRVAPAVLSSAEEQGSDLIALATQARSGLARIFKPSIAAQIVRHSHIPILVCGPANSTQCR